MVAAALLHLTALGLEFHQRDVFGRQTLVAAPLGVYLTVHQLVGHFGEAAAGSKNEYQLVTTFTD